MKATFNARIVGHEVFTPDKKEPTFQLLRVKLEIAPGSERTDKPTRCALAVQLERKEEYPLLGFIRIALEDSQQVLDLKGANHKPSKPPPQLALTPGKGRKRTPPSPEDHVH